MTDTSIIFSSFAGALLFYLIPLNIGYMMTNIIRLLDKKEEADVLFSVLRRFFLSFMVGSVVIYVTALTVNQVNTQQQDFLSIYPLVLKIICLVCLVTNVIFFLARALQKPRQLHCRISRNTFFTFLLIFILSLSVYGIWKFKSPYNTSLNWDIYHQQTLATEITKGHFDYATSKLSDSFQFEGYSTMFHTLLASPQFLVNTDILTFWWFLEYFHLLIVAIASFMLGYAITGRKLVGLIGALMGMLFFEGRGSYTNLFLIPQNLTAVMTSATMAMVVKYLIERENKQDTTTSSIKKLTWFFMDSSILIYFIYAMLNHYIIGFLGIFYVFVALVFLFINDMPKLVRFEKTLVILSLVVTLVFPILVSYVNLDFVNRGEAAFFKPTLAEKYDFIKDTYGYILFILLPLGILYVLRQKESQYKPLTILLFGCITLFVAPLPYVMKLLSIGRFFIYTVMALGFWSLIKNAGRFVKIIGMITLTLILFLIFTSNVVKYKQVPVYKDIYSHVSPRELEAAKFLKQNYKNRDVLLISEPSTMHIIEGLTGINSPGGAYAENQTRQILNNIYYNRDSDKMINEFSLIRDGLHLEKPKEMLLIVDGRFSKWEKASDERKYGIHWNVWTPYDLNINEQESYSFIDFAVNKGKFKVIYRNEGVVILEATNL